MSASRDTTSSAGFITHAFYDLYINPWIFAHETHQHRRQVLGYRRRARRNNDPTLLSVTELCDLALESIEYFENLSRMLCDNFHLPAFALRHRVAALARGCRIQTLNQRCALK